MKKGFISSIMAFVLMIYGFTFSSVASAAATSEFIMKPGETYEFVLVKADLPTYQVQFSQQPIRLGNQIDILELDRDNETIREMKGFTGNASFNVYAEGRTLVTNTGISDYKLSFDPNYIAGQKVGKEFVPVEQTGKVTIQPGETFKAAYTASEARPGIDVAVDNPNGNSVTYSVYANGEGTSGSGDGYFAVNVPYQGSAEFTNEGTTEVVLNYFTHWVTVSKLQDTVPLTPVKSIYNILAVEPGQTIKVTDVNTISSTFTIEPNGGKFTIATYSSDGQELTAPTEYAPSYKYTSSVTGYGDYAIVTNTSTEGQSLYVQGRYSNYKLERQ
ncbi:hypothetical protein PUW24_06135 [Paenibacillus urinalis]|uniref:Uncharacterized protein n=1 Tax=Paenibacillus urinalis TaxID=521520 RepID=A0AAX3MXX2_9BACL|nr:hypothetical protein [Paenibacillus urinalis]WDH82445.1 hypothetical protein PUW23_23865 [Paenibacillus urinalis]WDH98502.1 hypothetical protein PUW24_06135 [Paenibacillus urinalis]WDI02193.1 hypothetical protein PUW25_23860 [Paenibacillus urinalis]